jgi:hypothetical protein
LKYFSAKFIDGYIKFDSLNHFVEDKMLRYGWRTQINIGDFIFKCKEWAISLEYDICSGYDSDIADGMYFCKIENYKFREVFAEYDKSEVELVIDACEWILKTIPIEMLDYFRTRRINGSK